MFFVTSLSLAYLSQSSKEPTSLLENAQQKTTTEIPAPETANEPAQPTVGATETESVEQKSDVPDIPAAPEPTTTPEPAQSSSEKQQDIPTAP